MEKGGFCISTMASSNIAILLTIGVITVLVIRIIYIINRSRKPLHSKSPRSLSTLIVLGSGGHTAEMLNLLYVLQTERFKPRYYIAAATDNMSLQKAHVFEDSLLGKEAPEEVGRAEYMQIYRSREVGQSYITSVGTTLVAIAHALWLMIKIRPQVILCNGPGTCIPLCVIAFLFKKRMDHTTLRLDLKVTSIPVFSTILLGLLKMPTVACRILQKYSVFQSIRMRFLELGGHRFTMSRALRESGSCL